MKQHHLLFLVEMRLFFCFETGNRVDVRSGHYGASTLRFYTTGTVLVHYVALQQYSTMTMTTRSPPGGIFLDVHSMYAVCRSVLRNRTQRATHAFLLQYPVLHLTFTYIIYVLYSTYYSTLGNLATELYRTYSTFSCMYCPRCAGPPRHETCCLLVLARHAPARLHADQEAIIAARSSRPVNQSLVTRKASTSYRRKEE